ncbi:hypothetical protein O6H91_Y579100 [Diphasiastrum complanatum]|nr:hypothetical protein O6H91_Y579100 [Diphasiastrum complanatum]
MEDGTSEFVPILDDPHPYIGEPQDDHMSDQEEESEEARKRKGRGKSVESYSPSSSPTARKKFPKWYWQTVQDGLILDEGRAAIQGLGGLKGKPSSMNTRRQTMHL